MFSTPAASSGVLTYGLCSVLSPFPFSTVSVVLCPVFRCHCIPCLRPFTLSLWMLVHFIRQPIVTLSRRRPSTIGVANCTRESEKGVSFLFVFLLLLLLRLPLATSCFQSYLVFLSFFISPAGHALFPHISCCSCTSTEPPRVVITPCKTCVTVCVCVCTTTRLRVTHPSSHLFSAVLFPRFCF